MPPSFCYFSLWDRMLLRTLSLFFFIKKCMRLKYMHIACLAVYCSHVCGTTKSTQRLFLFICLSFSFLFRFSFCQTRNTFTLQQTVFFFEFRRILFCPLKLFYIKWFASHRLGITTHQHQTVYFVVLFILYWVSSYTHIMYKLQTVKG